VVFTNAQSLNNGVRWIGELLVEALFDNLNNASDYRSVAEKAAESSIQRSKEINKSFAEGRIVEKPVCHLAAYIGYYSNTAQNFFIHI